MNAMNDVKTDHTNAAWHARRQAATPRGVGVMGDFFIERAKNAEFWDIEGRRFIDFIPAEDTPSPHEDLETKTWSEQLQQLMKTLTPMEARIVRWRFGLDNEDELTLKEIGDKYNLSRERIRQLQEQALGKMRRHVQV